MSILTWTISRRWSTMTLIGGDRNTAGRFGATICLRRLPGRAEMVSE